MKFIVRQIVKMAVQNVLLPAVYRIHRKKTVKQRRVLFADAHHDSIPYSMEYVRRQLEGSGWDIGEYFFDYQGHSALAVLRSMLTFMRDYANVRYVFICDNFLPVSSCKKRPETCVVQLWHAGGILKKYAYDTPDDIPDYYRGNVYKNYDIVTVSAPVCVPVYERAMRLSRESVYPIGISRTDCFFDECYLRTCREEFYRRYPDAAGKRVVLFAPTFRGKASDPYLVGGEWIAQLERKLNAGLAQGETPYKVYIRVHPHLDNKRKLSNIDLATERLLPVIDLLISDVSSVIFDYVLLQKPLVLFIPDLRELESTRGFYIPLTRIPGQLVTEGEQLAEAVQSTMEAFYRGDGGDGMRGRLRAFSDLYMGSCDGHATGRLLALLGISDAEEVSGRACK